MHRINLLVTLSLAAAISAQSTSVVFPADRVTTEGTGNNVFPLGRQQMRYQQLELEAKGKAFVVRGMEFRRNGTSPSNVAARTVTLTIRVGSGNANAFGTTFANNWVGMPTTMVNAQTFNMPALPLPPAPPAPFAIKFPFATPTGHAGTNEMLWEIVNNSTAPNRSYVCDAESRGTVRARVLSLGRGCMTNTSGRSTFFLSAPLAASTNQTTLSLSAFRAPANAPVLALIGGTNPDLQLPGACEKLFTLPVVSIALGAASSTGSVTTRSFPFGPWNPSWAGAKLYLQGFAPDSSQTTGFVLSGGSDMTLPNDPPAAAQHRLFATSATATSGSLGLGYGLVVRFP